MSLDIEKKCGKSTLFFEKVKKKKILHNKNENFKKGGFS